MLITIVIKLVSRSNLSASFLVSLILLHLKIFGFSASLFFAFLFCCCYDSILTILILGCDAIRCDVM